MNKLILLFISTFFTLTVFGQTETNKKYDTALIFTNEQYDSTAFELVEKKYQIVIDHQLADYNVYNAIGLRLATYKKYKESIPYLQKSINLKNDFTDSHFNLANACMGLDVPDSVIKYAKNALALFQKAETAILIAECYTEKRDYRNAIIYYELANKIEPNRLYNLKPLLKLCVRTGNKKANEITKKYFDLKPDGTNVYQELFNIYLYYHKMDELIEFFKEQLAIYKDDKKVLGYLNFYLGNLHLQIDKKELAKQYFLNALNNSSNEINKGIEAGIKLAEHR
ncbi:MAG: hypothetical protein RJA07_1034 [Bacteroidota bacterium]|jgi:tetratricopeptide (TPR) repeat protein